jgi:tyrosyl-tRNA synthetase
MSDFKSIPIPEQLEYLRKGAVEIIREEEARREAQAGAKDRQASARESGLRSTAPDIHLGHSVLMRKMKHFQDLGHTAIFLIGDFTSLIGDPPAAMSHANN